MTKTWGETYTETCSGNNTSLFLFFFFLILSFFYYIYIFFLNFFLFQLQEKNIEHRKHQKTEIVWILRRVWKLQWVIFQGYLDIYLVIASYFNFMESSCVSASGVTLTMWRQTKPCCCADRSRSTTARTRWPMTGTSKKSQSRSNIFSQINFRFSVCLFFVIPWVRRVTWVLSLTKKTTCFSLRFPDTCVSQAFTQRRPTSSESTADAHGTSRSNCGRSSSTPGTRQWNKAKTKPWMTCESHSGIALDELNHGAVVIFYHSLSLWFAFSARS